MTLAELQRLPWDRLSESALSAVADLVVELAGDFTGTIHVEARGGGVRRVHEGQDRKGPEIGGKARAFLDGEA